MGTLEHIAQSASTSLSGIQDLATDRAVLLGALAFGILIWLFGRRIVRPLLGLVAACVGGVLGFFLPRAVGLGVDPLLGLALGGVLGALVGVAMYRLSMAITFAGAMGLALPAIACMTLSATIDPDHSAVSEPLALSELFMTDVPVAADGFHIGAGDYAASASINSGAPAVPVAISDRVRGFMVALGDEAHASWTSLPDRSRLIILVASALGAVVGFLAGLAMPRHVASIGTALIGSAIWLPAGTSLIRTSDSWAERLLPASPFAWIAVWGVLALIGAATQVMTLRKPADKTPD